MNNEINEIFWSADINEIVKGYKEHSENYQCIICGERFIKGKIYSIDEELYDAKKAAELHINHTHGSMTEYLLNLNTAFTGLSDMQKEILLLIWEGYTDKEISQKLSLAASTIRNHRFKIREKEKQARILISLMSLLDKNGDRKIANTGDGILCDPHKSANMVDDRFNTTDKEKETVLSNYIDADGKLITYPTKEKRKIIVLEQIAKNFSFGKEYSEREVNTVLEKVYDDYVTLRRALIEYGFLNRTKDGFKYWVKE